MLSNEYVDKAKNVTSKRDIIKYARKGLKMEISNYDLLQTEQKTNTKAKLRKLKQMLNFISSELTEKSMSDNKQINQDHILFKQYLGISTAYIIELILIEKYQEALNEGLGVIALDPQDHYEINNLILHCCVYLGNYDKAMQIDSLYPNESLSHLVPLMLLHFQNNKMEEFNNTISKIEKANKHFVEILGGYSQFNGEEASDILERGIYEKGQKSEALALLQEYVDVIFGNEELIDWFRTNDVIKEETSSFKS